VRFLFAFLPQYRRADLRLSQLAQRPKRVKTEIFENFIKNLRFSLIFVCKIILYII